MRLLAWFCTLCAALALAFAGHMLWQSLNSPRTPLTQAAPDLLAVTPEVTSSTPQAPRQWPYLFGEPKPPVPQQEPQPPKTEPQPPKPPKPPLESLGYRLKGVVRAGQATWAILSHPTGDQLLREGDTLEGQAVVTGIEEAGIWISRDGDTPEFLAFEPE